MPRIRLASDNRPTAFRRALSRLVNVRDRATLRRALLKSVGVTGLPVAIRPAFVVLTALSLLLLATLGIHPTLAEKVSPPVPFSDKLLHFIGLCIATVQFYAIWTVDENVRRVWYWRHFNELISVVVCGFFGGVVSEFIQGLLPYKTFQWGDIVANLLGVSLGIFMARELTIAHRRSQELRRLYQPVHLDSVPESDDSDNEEEERSTRGDLAADQEMEEGRGRAEAQLGVGPGGEVQVAAGRGQKRTARIEENVWDDQEEIFGLGDDDEEEGDARRRS